jgi:hypothetical protein
LENIAAELISQGLSMRERTRTDLCPGAISDGRPYRDSATDPATQYEADENPK